MRTPIFKKSMQPGSEHDLGDILGGLIEGPGDLAAAAAPAVRSRLPGSRSTVHLVSSIDTVSAQAERAVVGAVLADNTLYDLVIDILGAGDFLDPAAAAVFKVTGDIIEGNISGTSVAEPMTVSVQPGISFLISLAGIEQWTKDADKRPDVLAGRARIIRDAAAERGLDAAVVQAQTILAEDKTVESKSAEIEKLLSGASAVRSLPIKSLGAAATEALSQMAERAKNGESGIGITTGFRDLDTLTAGFHPGQLIVIAARPGIGKTALVMSMGLSASAVGHTVVMASMEMKAMELSKRALAIYSGVDSHAIRLGALTESDWEALVEAADALLKLPFEIVDLPSVNLSALSGLCRRLKREGKLSMLVVDYLQIMEVSGAKGMTREQQIAEISRGLKKIAMALEIPVIVLSQLNRAVEARVIKRPQLSDLRESGAIEQDADVVIFIHRENAGNKNAPAQDVAEIIVEKQRAGAPGEVQVRFERVTTGFFDFESMRNNNPLRQVA